jgi:dTDP-4-amino-4,6-dideoxygalactose transaminase
MQAALLRVKLTHLKELNDERNKIANMYDKGIKNIQIELPTVRQGSDSIYHQYVVKCQNRDALQKFLQDNGIQTQIHYPIPPHLAKCYEYLEHKKGEYPITERYANEVLSLPIYTGMTDEEVGYVIAMINEF